MNLTELKQKPIAQLLDIANEMGLENVEPRPKLNVSRSNLGTGPQVVLLDYKA